MGSVQEKIMKWKFQVMRLEEDENETERPNLKDMKVMGVTGYRGNKRL